VETLLVWTTRLILLALGAGAAVWLARWLRDALRERRETWAVRTALLMLLLALVSVGGHLWLLGNRTAIEQGRMRYAVFGDPRLAEIRRAEVRGWLLDCTGENANALARYGPVDGDVRRVHPLGEAGANLVGGGAGAEERDFTVERLFASRLREPMGWRERGQLHPAGSDLQLTLCAGATRRAWQLLAGAARPGAVVVQDVATGAVVAYAATGGPDDAPIGIRRYAPPGSVFKLALAALWWESGLPETVMGCPATMQVTPRAVISNYGNFSIASVQVPHGMLVPSCNTTAVEMALQMRERLGTQAFLDAYRRYGFAPYAGTDAPRIDTDFWSTSSAAWTRRMSPPASRLRMSEETGPAEWAQLAIGQGPLDVTVIGVSRFLQAIGNEGTMLRPTLEAELAGSPAEVERVMSRETAQRLQAAMRDVVDRGTARASAAPRLRATRWDLGGKTGTAEVGGARDDGWFAGLIHDPTERPRYTVVVYLQGGGPGGGAPSAIAAEMTRFLAQERAAGEQREQGSRGAEGQRSTGFSSAPPLPRSSALREEGV
jgi:cell division protein FtsI/penicillin-binding protein 2